MCPVIPGGRAIGTDSGVPFNDFRYFKAGAAISKGNLVKVSEVADDGITVIKTAAATDPCCGVATADVASGAWGKFQVKGLCTYVVTDGTVTASHLVHPSATAGTADSTAYASYTSVQACGQALADDSGTVASAVYLNCFGA